MTRSIRLARWAVFIRWGAYIAVGAIVMASYSSFHAARAQDKGKAPAGKPAAKPATEPTAGPLSAEQAQRMAEAALAEGEKGKKETKPAAETVEKREFNIIEEIRHGGVHMWAVYAILVVSIVSVAFAVERILGLRRSKVLPRELVAGLKAMAGQKGGFDPRQAYRLCREYPSTAATVIKAMLLKAGRPLSEVEHAAAQISEREGSRLYANVRWQNLAFNVAPMLGLAGTVHGIILAFFQTANLGTGVSKMEALAVGIYAALICTLMGLIVAIPAGILAHAFEGRILRLLREQDDVITTLVPLLERFEGRQRVSRTPGGETAVAEAVPPPPVDEPKRDVHIAVIP